ncbi:MAG: hypothetical protein KAT62_03540 [Desulfuromonadales bacterium]|nr:hypothetical protein [Desulfuromonadales bacterium]
MDINKASNLAMQAAFDGNNMEAVEAVKFLTDSLKSLSGAILQIDGISMAKGSRDIKDVAAITGKLIAS